VLSPRRAEQYRQRQGPIALIGTELRGYPAHDADETAATLAAAPPEKAEKKPKGH
jgi:hypothetical protein